MRDGKLSRRRLLQVSAGLTPALATGVRTGLAASAALLSGASLPAASQAVTPPPTPQPGGPPRPRYRAAVMRLLCVEGV